MSFLFTIEAVYYFLKKNRLFFESSFSFIAEWSGKYKGFPNILCQHTCTASPTMDIPHQIVKVMDLP